ncbi:transcriptional enhancer factor TEF-3 isoform X2 [Mustela nigripes]|uniref:transcriptional enhancer factor TEF-3 isoform X2 n=1 Tax=Mustela nigripes TaxID=77151 RepID=UPI002814D87B|nr:transcriptional enhancer factor TEF-3 isoform X2 [Mustela nigripes]
MSFTLVVETDDNDRKDQRRGGHAWGARAADLGPEPGSSCFLVPRSECPLVGAAGKGAALPARWAPAPSPASQGLVRSGGGRDAERGRATHRSHPPPLPQPGYEEGFQLLGKAVGDWARTGRNPEAPGRGRESRPGDPRESPGAGEPRRQRPSRGPSFRTFRASSFQTPGQGAGRARAPGSRRPRPRPPGPTGAPPSGALEGKAGTITSNEWSPPNSPEGSNVSGGSQALDKPIDNDAEGVWSPDIEQSFQEALAIYPPCGRRKIILSDEGKMYGRNELIARYIKLRTGKTRTRKQVSSHIQVLARRKAREIQAKLKFWQGALPGQAGTSHDVKPFSQQTYTVQPSLPLPGFESPAGPTPSPSAPPAPPWQGRSVASSKLWMLEFSAFLEQQQDPDTYNKHLFVHIGQSSPSYSDPYLEAVDIRQIYDKFPEKKGGLKELFERGPSNAFFLVKFWADLNTNIEDEGSSFYGVSSQYESPENMIITCSTKVCSFGKQVVEKVETEYARYENGHYSYRIHRSPLCEYMINFIHKLKHLPEKYMMNSVLENFTILQVVTNRDTQETLLCVAYVFEVSASEHGAQHHIYRLVKE